MKQSELAFLTGVVIAAPQMHQNVAMIFMGICMALGILFTLAKK